MYVVGAYLIDMYSGMKFADFVQARIFKPLKMTSSTFNPAVALDSGRFSASWTPEGRLMPRWYVGGDRAEVMGGAGGIVTSAEDFTRWMIALLDVSHGKEVKGIPSKALTDPMRPHALNRPSPTFGLAAYGLGWWITTYKGHSVSRIPIRSNLNAL